MDRSLSVPSGHQERSKGTGPVPAKYGARWLEPSKDTLNKSQDFSSTEFAQPLPVNGKGDDNVQRRMASVYSKRTWPPKPSYKSHKSMEDTTVVKEKSRNVTDGNILQRKEQRNGVNIKSSSAKSKHQDEFYDHFQEPRPFQLTPITKNLKPVSLAAQGSRSKPTSRVHESSSAERLSNSTSTSQYSSFDRPKPYVKPKNYVKSLKNESYLADLRPQSENSFFDMVKDYKNDLRRNVDQRSPASKTMTKVLGSGLDAALAMALPAANIGEKLANQDPSGSKKGSGASTEAPCSALKCWSLDKDRPRQSFAHYDWQSITFSFTDVLVATETLKRKNETTGASKAAALTERMHSTDNSPASSTENLQDLKITDNPEDSTTNDVLGWCPFFCNEIGGETEDDIYLSSPSQASTYTQTPAVSVQLLLPENSSYSVTNSPTQAQMVLVNHKGVSVMEKIGIDDDKQLNAVGYIQEYVDGGALYYRKHFFQQDHQNFFGIDEKYGTVAISIKREKLKEANANIKDNAWHFRVIVRASELCTLRGSVLEDVIISQHHSVARALRTRDVLDYVCPEINFDCLKLAASTEAVQKQLLKVDEQNVANSYKIGIMYCKKGQTTEEEMYNNEHGSPALEEFLDLIGDRILLKGFEKFRGGLDVKTNSTGKESYFTTFQGIEIMFHVSTLLPYTNNNVQQLLRKRHIGNDIVTIVFQEPDSPPFSPKHIRSHFQHLFVVVRVHQPCSSRTSYRIAVTRSQDIPAFGPHIPKDALFPKSETFREFLLTKLLNGERAARSAGKFKAMAMNTRQEYLRDLAVNHCTQNSLDMSQKFSRFSLTAASRRVKDRDKGKNRMSTEESSLGALVWHVVLTEYGPDGIPCMLGISDYVFCLVRKSTNRVIFSIPCQAIIGWSDFSSETLHIYYGRGERLAITANSCSSCDWKREVRSRLQTFSIGCETKTKTLRRNARGQLGFHINYEGIVMDVEINGYANHVGLTQGSRLVEICKVLVVTMTHEEMLDLLRTSDVVTVIMIPPLEDGTPRRCSKSLYHVSPVLKMIELSSIGKNPSPAQSGDESVLHSRSRSDPAFKTNKHNKSLEDITQALAQSLNLKTSWERSQASSARNSAASTPTPKMNPQLSKRVVNQSSSLDPHLYQNQHHHIRSQPYHHQTSYDSHRIPQTARPNHFTTVPLKKSREKHFMGSSQMKHSTSTESGLNLNSYDYETKNPYSSADNYIRFAKPQNFKGPFHSASATNSAASTPTTKLNPLPTRYSARPSTERSTRESTAQPQLYHQSQQEPVFANTSDSNHFTTIPLKRGRDKFFPGSTGMKHSTSTESGLNMTVGYDYDNSRRYAPEVSFPPPSRKKKSSPPKPARKGDTKNELLQFVEQKHKNQPTRTNLNYTATPPLERRKPNNHINRQLTRAMSDESICGIVHNTRWRSDGYKERSRDNSFDPLLPLPNHVESWEQLVHAANTAEDMHTPPADTHYEPDYLHSGPSNYSTDEDRMFAESDHEPRSAASISPILPQDVGSSEEGGYEPLSHISSESDADLRLRKIEDALRSLQTQLAVEQQSKKKILREVERLRKDNRRLKEKANSQLNKDSSKK